MKVLAIGESQEVAKNIPFSLRLRWPDAIILSAAEGSKGLELVEAEAPDLVMADFSLPDMTSLELVGRIRELSQVLLVVLAEGGTAMDTAKLLEAGADDYITTPCVAVDVVAKVNALMRRAQPVGFGRNHMPLVSGDLAINLSTREVFLSEQRVRLTPHEYELLLHLVRNEGRVVPHRTLLEKAWGPEYVKDVPFLKKYVYRLRQKLNEDVDHPRMIFTVRGLGYMFSRRG